MGGLVSAVLIVEPPTRRAYFPDDVYTAVWNRMREQRVYEVEATAAAYSRFDWCLSLRLQGVRSTVLFFFRKQQVTRLLHPMFIR